MKCYNNFFREISGSMTNAGRLCYVVFPLAIGWKEKPITKNILEAKYNLPNISIFDMILIKELKNLVTIMQNLPYQA